MHVLCGGRVDEDECITYTNVKFLFLSFVLSYRILFIPASLSIFLSLPLLFWIKQGLEELVHRKRYKKRPGLELDLVQVSGPALS